MGTVTRREQARGRARRRQLTEAAAGLFARGGFRGTGIAAVAAEVGVTTATLLYHFGSKEGLLQAVLEHRDEQVGEQWEGMLEPGGLETLRRLPDVARSWQREPALARLYTVLLAESLEPDAPMHEWFARRQSIVRAGLRRTIETGQARGEIRADVDARSVAIEISAFMDGLGAEWALDPGRIPVVEVMESFCRRLVDDLATPDRPRKGTRRSTR